MAESGARSPFQYILCAATSPAVKQQEESLTYLNQGSSGVLLSHVVRAAAALRQSQLNVNIAL